MNSNPLKEQQELLWRIAVGDEAAFSRLFDLCRPGLFMIILRLVRGNTDWANDIYQEVFLRIWLKRTTLKEIRDVEAWLFTVARNVVFDALRQSEKIPVRDPPSGGIHPDTSYGPADILQEKEMQEVLSAAVGLLSERQRQTYNLIKIAGLSRSEAAAKMNISPETVKWNLEQAMRNIRAYCSKYLFMVPFFLGI